MMDMEYNRTSPFISNCLHYSSEFHPYVGEFHYICSIDYFLIPSRNWKKTVR